MEVRQSHCGMVTVDRIKDSHLRSRGICLKGKTVGICRVGSNVGDIMGEALAELSEESKGPQNTAVTPLLKVVVVDTWGRKGIQHILRSYQLPYSV